MMPGAVFSSLSVDDASPKSVSFTSPVYETRTFGGEMSRWTRFRSGKRVRVREAAAQLLDDVDRDVDRERDLLLRAAVPHRAQIAALDEVHREEQLAADQAGVEHRDQVAVRQLDDDLRFVAESRDVLGVGEVRQHGLDDHQALEPAVAADREVERAHAALRQGPQQVILAEFPGVMLQVSLVERHARRSYHGGIDRHQFRKRLVDRWC